MTKKRNINFDYVHIIINRVKRFLSFLLRRTNENSKKKKNKKKTLNDCKLLTAKSTVYDSFYCSILTRESFWVHSTVNSIFNLLLFWNCPWAQGPLFLYRYTVFSVFIFIKDITNRKTKGKKKKKKQKTITPYHNLL